MATARTTDPLQATSNREWAKHSLKRMAPGLLAVAGVMTLLTAGATLLPAVAGAIA